MMSFGKARKERALPLPILQILKQRLWAPAHDRGCSPMRKEATIRGTYQLEIHGGNDVVTVMPKEAIMREKFSIVSVAIAAAVISVSVTRTPAQAPVTAAAAPALKTPWGEPD